MVMSKKGFNVHNSRDLLTKYYKGGKELTIYIKGGSKFTGTLKWYDDYAIKIRRADKSGSVTIPIHNILYYQCEHFQLDFEQKQSPRVCRKPPNSTDKEKLQIQRYKDNKELLHIYMEDGTEVKGRIQWYTAPVYSIRPDDEDWDYMIIKRHILYYRKIRLY